MKRTLLTLVLALGLLTANAQWMITTTINKVTTIAGEDLKPGEVYDLDVCPGTKTSSINITDKLGIGYQLDDNFVVGIIKTGDLFVRYILNDKLFAICEYNYLHSTDDKISEHVVWGIGYSFSLPNNFYLEPNYTKAEEGSFNLSISYKI
jgi:hypothetical protein|tara:strand:+ start:75 stop:524 length:450 start_codon:yes stop_codon:yes gene_type:complete